LSGAKRKEKSGQEKRRDKLIEDLDKIAKDPRVLKEAEEFQKSVRPSWKSLFRIFR
jgi:hypothetical protein